MDDSSYDIMNDVYMLAKILFQGVENPVKTLFFKMPSVNYNSIYQEPKLNMDIDRFSPYNNYSVSNEGDDDLSTNQPASVSGNLIVNRRFFGVHDQ